MRKFVLFCALACGMSAFGVEIEVAVCNQGNLPEKIVKRAQKEAEYILGSADVLINWTPCGSVALPNQARTFVLRLRNDNAFVGTDSSSLDAMGRAFLSLPLEGFLVDAYFASIQRFAQTTQLASSDWILGHVIAHELGHLMLGPGHTPRGIMSTGWRAEELLAIRQRRLHFTKDERREIIRVLAYPAGQSSAEAPSGR